MNRTDEISEIEGKAAKVVASKQGSERVSMELVRETAAAWVRAVHRTACALAIGIEAVEVNRGYLI